MSRTASSKRQALRTLKPRVQEIGSRLSGTHPDSWRTNKLTSGQRGYTYRWQKESKAFLAEHPLCCYCEREGRVTVATIVDHKIPHRGDQTLFWDHSNWQSMCAPHHSSDKQREELA